MFKSIDNFWRATNFAIATHNILANSCSQIRSLWICVSLVKKQTNMFKCC
jgi:hypothetical protein